MTINHYPIINCRIYTYFKNEHISQALWVIFSDTLKIYNDFASTPYFLLGLEMPI